MEKRDPVEVLAAYLRKTARAGMGVSSNRKALAMHLGLSVAQVCAARDELQSCGRLYRGGHMYESIDGIPFGDAGKTEVKADRLMTYLRRKYELVVDARVVDKPEEVPRGAPREVIIGSVRTGIAFAAAAVLCTPGSRLLVSA